MAFETAFSSGFATGSEAAARRQAVDAQRAEREAKRREAIEKRFGDLFDQFFEAGTEGNEAAKNVVLDAINIEHKQTFGADLPKPFANLLRKSPKEAMEFLEQSASEGLPPSAVLEMAGNPVMLSQGIRAIVKIKGERARRQASAGPGEIPPTTTAPVTPTPEAREPISATIIDLRRHIGEKRAQIAKLAREGVAEKDLQKLRDDEIELTKKLIDLETGPAAKGAETRAQVAATPVGREEIEASQTQLLRLGQSRLAARLRPGMSREAFNTVMDIAVPEAAAPRPAEPGGLTTPEQRKAEEDFRQSELKKQETRFGEQEKLATKRLGEITKDADTKRSVRGLLGLIETELPNLKDVSGPLRGPFRRAVQGALQLFGVGSEQLASIQTMEAASNFLAAQLLKDFSGPDSDKDFLRAMETTPNLRKDVIANRTLLKIAIREADLSLQRAFQAAQWQSKLGSLAAKNPRGLNFEARWREFINSQPGIAGK